jgi:hypothetical protein
LFENFNWINEGEIKIKENNVTIKAPALTDFFCGGSTTSEEGILPESLRLWNTRRCKRCD